ncbi:MAG TPA: sigma-54 dependent transcriptional regulator [Burkholderiales bacterium]|nr:sigma-54 dependent transcriptional regulator [Burkholderiales bacterium]
MTTLDCAVSQLPMNAFALAREFAVRHDAPRARPAPAAVSGALAQLHGNSAPMKALHDVIERVAPTSASVLLVGESGTGKEVIANAIHAASQRARRPFVAINCGALPANLVEAELFGYEKGAFTGAVRAHQGCFERASGGTLFLDEITEMPAELQVTLLRALETGRFCRVGGAQEISVDVRVIAATNRDPAAAVAEGGLREDLLYRLAVFPIEVPALRERGDDIELLAQHFLDELNAGAGTGKRFSHAARTYLRKHSWPGNVRELRNAVQRAFILADATLDFGSAVATQPAFARRGNALQFRIGTPLEDIEREVIFATLAHCQGRRKETAELLGVSVKTLYNRLSEYGAQRPPAPTPPMLIAVA